MKNSGNLLVLGADGFLGKNVTEILEKGIPVSLNLECKKSNNL